MALPDKNADPQTLLADIEKYIADAQGMLARGETILLAGLDNAIDALCKRVLTLRADEATPFISRFEEMRDKLDALQEALGEEKKKVADAIGETNKRQKASKAYRPVEDKK